MSIFGRREFLSSSAAFATCTLLPAGRAWTAEPAAARPVLLYARGSEGRSSLVGSDASPRVLVPAETLEAPESPLRDVRVLIQGLGPDDTAAAELDQIELRVGHGGSPGAEAHAWSLVQRGGAPNVSSPVALRVNVAVSDGLRLSGGIVPRGGDPKAPLAFAIRLSPSGGGFRLRPGVYVLGFDGLTAPGSGIVFSVEPWAEGADPA